MPSGFNHGPFPSDLRKKKKKNSSLSLSLSLSMEMDSLPNGNTAPASAAVAAAAGAAAPSSKLSQLAESLKLEHQLLRVPFEHYKKTIRANQRIVEKEMSAVISGVAEAADADLLPDDAVHHLNSLVSRLQGLKRKLEEGSRTEHLQAQRCRARLDYLESADADNISEWNNTRLKRILVDYMLRMSYYDTAMKLAESSNIQDLVDIDVFHEAKRVIDALQNKEVAPALAWCAENKFRLKKAKSKFEFQLRLQEFIELVRAENSMRAITYARKYLAPWGATHMKELQRVMATLAFKSSTECATYKVLFEPKQWDYLVDQFKQEFCRLYGMTLEPLLNIYLQAGLSALKTPFCYEDDCPKDDPLSQESFRKLALPLPFSKQHHSKLVCYITKELMDTDNPPLVLPNGYVYSTKALEEMAKKNNGKVTCPRTGLVCNYSDAIKAFIS
ncbi:protein MAEA homolog [Malania oleifera]|uniref:protein MAEA homolog n=1 Tax=Malania oleifera TaxID=397392 RepID=UPI0025AE6F76|nr:protein MAEA homolog [Malania oleifera]